MNVDPLGLFKAFKHIPAGYDETLYMSCRNQNEVKAQQFNVVQKPDCLLQTLEATSKEVHYAVFHNKTTFELMTQ